MMMKLRQFREKRGWSQAELSRRSNLNQVTVCQIEGRRLVPYPGQLAKLAHALGLSEGQANELMEEVNDANVA